MCAKVKCPLPPMPFPSCSFLPKTQKQFLVQLTNPKVGNKHAISAKVDKNKEKCFQ